ncbi:MAG: hypothetical protein M3Z85_04105, partial [Acidobacteriota bacterium]|nr:hypothetical protein [Acidobacteriota bacterium]
MVLVPEEDAGGTVRGAIVTFRVPANNGRSYTGKIARLAHSLDQKTRSLAAELDVLIAMARRPCWNVSSGEVPVRWARPALFVPKSSVVTTAGRAFVIRVRNGSAEWKAARSRPVGCKLAAMIRNFTFHSLAVVALLTPVLAPA